MTQSNILLIGTLPQYIALSKNAVFDFRHVWWVQDIQFALLLI